MRLSNARKCKRCRRVVAWTDNYGWCVGCKRADLEPNERSIFDWIRAQGEVNALSVPNGIMEILLWEDLIEVEYSTGIARESRHF